MRSAAAAAAGRVALLRAEQVRQERGRGRGRGRPRPSAEAVGEGGVGRAGAAVLTERGRGAPPAVPARGRGRGRAGGLGRGRKRSGSPRCRETLVALRESALRHRRGPLGWTRLNERVNECDTLLCSPSGLIGRGICWAFLWALKYVLAYESNCRVRSVFLCVQIQHVT